MNRSWNILEIFECRRIANSVAGVGWRTLHVVADFEALVRVPAVVALGPRKFRGERFDEEVHRP